MISTSTFERIATALVVHAANSLPPSRRDWGRAMSAELDRIDSETQKMHWAFGCVIASYTERFHAMIRSNFIIPKWLLAVEASVFLFPVSLLWFISVLNLKVLASESAIVVATMLLTIAPINLWLAFRFIAGRRPLYNRFHLVSAILFAVYAIPQILGIRYSYGGPTFAWFQFDWRLVLLFSVLPALCCWHLSMFAKTSSDRMQPA